MYIHSMYVSIYTYIPVVDRDIECFRRSGWQCAAAPRRPIEYMYVHIEYMYVCPGFGRRAGWP